MRTRTRTAAVGLLAAACLSAPGGAAGAGLKLHVPSPDWRDQVIYFVMTDRFADGDPRNNDQGAGEYAAGIAGKFNGGDLRGLRQRLAYIQGLGATALWITPPVDNQWTDPWGGYTGYHGYWAAHFMRIDKHLGTLADYRLLSDALHRRGMYLVQDIVVNHTGNFFRYAGGWDAREPASHWQPNTGTRPVARPSQSPFHQNDPRDTAQRRAGIYHWTPDVRDYTDPVQEASFQMSGLDDLNTENPEVRRALRRSYGFWVREVGVDAFRVDTAFYVPPDYFVDFLHAKDAEAPGMAAVARRTGRQDFFVFGEGFGIDKPFADQQAKKIERWMTAPSGKPVLSGMLNFPLYAAVGDAFARGRPTAELAHRIGATMRLHARPHRMPSFVDNHDVDRFLAGGTVAGLKQALLAIFTLPGIPVIYYGTEQGFTEQRASMFAAGFGSGGRDRYDSSAPLYRAIASLAKLRREQRLLSRGTPTVLHANAAQAGAIAWRIDHEGAAALVVMNSSEQEALLHDVALAGAAGRGVRLEPLFAIDGVAPALTLAAGEPLTFKLPPRSGFVWKIDSAEVPAAARAPIGLDALPAGAAAGDFTVTGTAAPGRTLKLVVDGDLAQARRVEAGADGRWQAVLDTASMIDPAVEHRVVAWDEAGGTASPARSFRVDRPWVQLADIEDPAADDRGPQGAYVYPTDPTWAAQRWMDLQRVRVSGAGGALRLELTLPALSNAWNPQNGFDHVAFTVFIELPGASGGARVMPQQQAELPAGMRWHRRLRVHGWSNALFSDEGASATADGAALAPAARVEADAKTGRVTLTLPAASLGRPASLSGARIYVTTWDYDGGYRGLSREPHPSRIGGGDPERGAKVMDDTAVIVLP